MGNEIMAGNIVGVLTTYLKLFLRNSLLICSKF